MPDNDTWPPKPSLPDPLAEHDALIEASLPTLSAVTLAYDLVLPLSGVPFSNSAWVMNWTLRLRNPLSPMSERLERRLRLTQVLMEERGLASMQADAVVQDYYQRHGMAEIPKGAGKSLALSLVVIALAFVAVFSGAFDFFLSFHRDVILSRPNHGAAIIALDNARSLLRTVAFALLGLVYGFWLLRSLVRRPPRRGCKKPRQETPFGLGGEHQREMSPAPFLRPKDDSLPGVSTPPAHPGTRPLSCPTTTPGPRSPPCPTRWPSTMT